MNMTHMLELERVARLHADNPDQPVKLNGESRILNMSLWECGTGACLLGSYALTPHGKEYFKIVADNTMISNMSPLHIPVPRSFLPQEKDGTPIQPPDPMDTSAKHFDITVDDATYLFDPDRYVSTDTDDEEIDPEDVLARVLEYTGNPR